MTPLETSEFWSFVEIRGKSDCWLWRGKTKGYGSHYFRSERRSIAAHVAAFEIDKGPIARGNFVRHTCNNPPCCNPRHLVQGTRHDRSKYARPGPKRSAAKVPAPNPVSLKKRAAYIALQQGLIPVAIVARHAGVSRMTAYRWAKEARKGGEVVDPDAAWQQAIDEAKTRRK